MAITQKQHETENLDRVYLCTACCRSFLFRYDVEDHREQLGHVKFTIFTLEGKLLET